VLGPLLFIIYTNDLHNSLKHSKCILFADDTTVLKSGNNIHDIISTIENDLESLHDWFCSNKLSLNVNKTNFMLFFPKTLNNDINIKSIKLGNQIVERVSKAKFVGIHIDDGLQWDEHIQHVTSKLSSGAYAINASKRILSQDNLKQLYYSLVYPHLTYGILLWGSAFKYKLRKIEVTQNKVVRNILNAPYNSSTATLYKHLNMLKLSDIYKIQLGKLMYDYTHAKLPRPLLDIFTPNITIHDHNTRKDLILM